MGRADRALRAFLLAAMTVAAVAAGPIAPASSAMLSPGDAQAYRGAFTAVRTGDFAKAYKLAAPAKDPLLGKVLRWLELSRPGTPGRFAEIVEFIEKNPEWPGIPTLKLRAEDNLGTVPDAVAANWLKNNPPATPSGKLRQADLLLASGNREAATAIVRGVWVENELAAGDETSLPQRFPDMLRPEDTIKRIDRLAWDGREDAAKRMYPLVPEGWRALVEARLKLAVQASNAEDLLARVPRELQKDPGLLYERIRWLRRRDQYDGAYELASVPPVDLVRPIQWWQERQILARRALNDGQPALAYKLVAGHGLVDDISLMEAEFLAGWISLRFLEKPQDGYDHFVRLYDTAKLPISVARGAYWAGRAADAMKFHQLAAVWYMTAAEHSATYYGQLAADTMADAPPPRIIPEPQPTAEARVAFERREIVRAAYLLNELGEVDRVKPFVLRLSELAKTANDHALVANLAEALSRPDLSVSVAKRASYAGTPLMHHGYPILPLPGDGTAEKPLVLAMARQESAFDVAALSPSGARGLMQLMPATATQVAKSLSLPYNANRLLTDASYNLTLGRTYLDGLLDNFSGSYVLSIAAYNAGPGRVKQWVRDLGDPRAPDVDVIDWVERIPFNETRNYVQRVLENLQVYRLRVGDQKLAFSLARDLQR